VLVGLVEGEKSIPPLRGAQGGVGRSYYNFSEGAKRESSKIEL